jgi:hypothetical protein
MSRQAKLLPPSYPSPCKGEGIRHHFFVKRDPPYIDPPRGQLRELKPAEQEKVAQRKAAVYEHMPELVPIVKELHEAGMIDGWRSVSEVTLLREVEYGTA